MIKSRKQLNEKLYSMDSAYENKYKNITTAQQFHPLSEAETRNLLHTALLAYFRSQHDMKSFLL
jgi:hypothetical protein